MVLLNKIKKCKNQGDKNVLVAGRMSSTKITSQKIKK
jgi:hypothetical protein